MEVFAEYLARIDALTTVTEQRRFWLGLLILSQIWNHKLNGIRQCLPIMKHSSSALPQRNII